MKNSNRRINRGFLLNKRGELQHPEVKVRFKKQQPKAAEVEKRKKHTHWSKIQVGDAERLSAGFSQPMLPAGQLDTRPKKHHIMTESHGRLSGKCLTVFSSFAPAALSPRKREGTANRC